MLAGSDLTKATGYWLVHASRSVARGQLLQHLQTRTSAFAKRCLQPQRASSVMSISSLCSAAECYCACAINACAGALSNTPCCPYQCQPVHTPLLSTGVYFVQCASLVGAFCTCRLPACLQLERLHFAAIAQGIEGGQRCYIGQLGALTTDGSSFAESRSGLRSTTLLHLLAQRCGLGRRVQRTYYAHLQTQNQAAT
jgi:hypothetical protein